jgi:hypothetical protein
MMISFLTEKIRLLERAVLKRVKLKPEYEKLMTVPGIGMILALTIMLETGDISRFAGVGNYASYCRCVRSTYLSDCKKIWLSYLPYNRFSPPGDTLRIKKVTCVSRKKP